jgi:hypothetical protein
VTVLVVGANPGLTLFAADEDERPVGYASLWRVDWSPHGTGVALVVWHAGRTRVVSAAPDLGGWLASEFNRHFPEVRGLPWPEPEVTVAPVEMESDMAHGVRAEGADILLEISDPLDRRLVQVGDFDLGGRPYALSTVISPCRRGTLRIAGAPVAGSPRVVSSPHPRSSAFLADAEVWCEGTDQPG